MGGTHWSDDDYRARATTRAATKTSTFAYHDSVASGAVATAAHKTLDPKGVKVRESRDSAAHPESHAVAVLLDVTGSMSSVPRIVQANLPKLMGLLIRKGYLAHPHILVGAIGDATSDKVPLQVGQFEAGIEIENDITNLYLEGNGGGQMMESYELALHFMARHTSMDCFEKRGKRGYLFIIGDEKPYPRVKRNEVASVIGDALEADISVKDILAEAQRTFDVYYILPNMTSHWSNSAIAETWRGLVGQNFLRLEDPNGICELIAATIGIGEGAEIDRVQDDLKDAGASASLATSVGRSLATIASGRPRGAEVALPDNSGSGGGLATL